MSSYYIGRQPILDSTGATYAYELLFRFSQQNAYNPEIDGDTATAQVLVNTLMEAGFDSLVGSKYAFINCTNTFLEDPELLALLPPQRCVLEVLETVEVNDAVVNGVNHLKDIGFTVALDDYTNEPHFERLLPLADIIKYDLTDYSINTLAEFRQTDHQAGRRSLVERVETHDEFIALSNAGFDYFQGYYFAKPRVISGTQLTPNKLTVLQLFAEINDPKSTIDDLAAILSQDASLGIRTLKYVNSPITGLASTVSSVKHATALLGRNTIRNWINLILMSNLDDKPEEVVKLALTRARFCQLMAKEERLKEDGKYFTIGLLSLIDVLTDTAMDDALSEMCMDAEIVEQLTQRTGFGGAMLETVEHLEKPDGCELDQFVSAQALELYQTAVQWTEQAYLI